MLFQQYTDSAVNKIYYTYLIEKRKDNMDK